MSFYILSNRLMKLSFILSSLLLIALNLIVLKFRVGAIPLAQLVIFINMPVCLILSTLYNKILHDEVVYSKLQITRYFMAQTLMNITIAFRASIYTMFALFVTGQLVVNTESSGIFLVQLIYLSTVLSLNSSVQVLSQHTILSVLVVQMLIILDYIVMMISPDIKFLFTYLLSNALPRMVSIQLLSIYFLLVILLFAVINIITIERDLLANDT